MSDPITTRCELCGRLRETVLCDGCEKACCDGCDRNGLCRLCWRARETERDNAEANAEFNAVADRADRRYDESYDFQDHARN